MTIKGNVGQVHKLLWPLVRLSHFLLTTSLLQSWVYVLLYTAWATCVCVICHKVKDLSFDTTLLGVFGTILGFIISFRTSTAFERYNEGKKLMSSIAYASRTFARIVWFHIPLVPNPTTGSGNQQGQPRPTIISKSPSEILEEKRTAISLIEAFNIAVKHHLREIGLKQEESEKFNSRQGGTSSEERPRVKRADSSWASDVTAHDSPNQPGHVVIEVKPEPKDEKGELDGENPTAQEPGSVQYPRAPSGSSSLARNTPLEITFCLSSYIVALQERQVEASATNNMIMSVNQLVQSFTDLEKVSADQIPYSYRSQLWCSAYLYIFFLPFQLWKSLKYIAVPGTSLAALIFLGLLSAGEEIENPFNGDRNDLDMDKFCDDFSEELKTLMGTDVSTSNSESGALEGRIDQVLQHVRSKEKGEATMVCRKTWLGRKCERVHDN